MSIDHKANAAAAAAAMGIDPAALNRIAQPPTRADAAAAPAPAAPAMPHGGLRELAGLVSDVATGAVSTAASAFRRFANPVQLQRSNDPPPLPSRALPSFLTAVRLSGGAEALGSSLRDVEGIAPRWLTSSGDVTVSLIAVRDAHRLLPSVTMSRVLDALPRTTPLKPATEPGPMASLIEALAAETRELRDELLAEMRAERIDYRYADEVSRRFEWLLLAAVQDRLLPAEVAARETWRAFNAPLQHAGGIADGGRPGKPFVESVSFRAAQKLLESCHITEKTLQAMAERAAQPDSWFLEGRAHARALVAHEAEIRGHAKAKAAADDHERYLDTVRTVSPKGAGLIVCRRAVPAAKSEAVTFRHVAPDPEIRFGTHAYLLGARRWPSCISMPRTVVATERNGIQIGFDVLGDDETFEISNRIIERGQRARAPRWVLEGNVAAAREQVARKAPSPIAKFVDARDKTELRKRMAIFREHLDGAIADLWSPGFDVHTAAIDMGIAIQFGVIALRIDPAIVANEIGKRQKGADIPSLSESGVAMARNPKLWAFLPDAAVEAAT